MKNLLLIILLFIVGCKSEVEVDLSKIGLLENTHNILKKMNISNIQIQDGYWEVVEKNDKFDLELHNNGNISTIYNLNSIKDRKKFYFDDISINKNLGGKIIENKNTIAFVDVNFDDVETFNILRKLKNNLGDPDQILKQKIFYKTNDSQIKTILKVFDDKEYNLKNDEFEDKYLFYPLHYIWNVNGYIYKYTIQIKEISFNNNLIIISNKAFNEKLIFGYHNPKEDIILKKYYNDKF